MAASPFNPKSHHHARSNSFPTRTHPLISEFNEQLSRLRDSEEPSSSSASISKNLNGLQDLHECVDKLLLLPFSQAVAREQQEKWFNELLDGSLRLLDVCNVARDALLQTKERILEFQSTLRRRRGSRMELAKEVEKYLTCRKVVKKAMQKASKRMQSNFKEKNNDSLPIVTMLNEVETTTIWPLNPY
ncbi:hypothetical protein CJ030_MR4G014273 [Morella rubra]|uniref:Uncharacterized protein n=1 Tax=Morella rubra TaxID=262757 RepID=A0A6A1VYC4_9ROSI|nr:hypothetical protein CJ030_MR4G014273 [Morella rubra]